MAEASDEVLQKKVQEPRWDGFEFFWEKYELHMYTVKISYTYIYIYLYIYTSIKKARVI